MIRNSLFLGPQHQDIKLMDVIVKMVCISFFCFPSFKPTLFHGKMLN
jgi:hypothetical protein